MTLNRDARHLALPQVGSPGQQRIAAGRVLLIGAGGIGCAAATYLASSGVGQLTIVDFDTVDETNLGRQVLYTPGDIGELKANIAAARLSAQNPEAEIRSVTRRLDDTEMAAAVAGSDVVLDGCDNFATRFQVNDACVRNGRRLVSGAAIRLEGQLAVFGPDYSSAPCYRCLYAAADESLENCSGNGVLAAVPGVIGSLMAVEALKFFTGMVTDNAALHLYDALATEFRTVRINKREDCPTCAATAND